MGGWRVRRRGAFCLVIFLLFSSILQLRTAQAGPNDDWDNLEIIGRNKELAHATLLPYPSAGSALSSSSAADSIYHKLLSQTNWKFKWVAKPADRPVGFESPGYDVSGWDDIPVPSSGRRRGTAHRFTATSSSRLIPMLSIIRRMSRIFPIMTIPLVHTAVISPYLLNGAAGRCLFILKV